MAALNSRVKALLGPKAVMFIQDTLPFSVAPNYKNLDVPDDLLHAMQRLTLSNSTGSTDISVADEQVLAEDNGDVSAAELVKMMRRVTLSRLVAAASK